MTDLAPTPYLTVDEAAALARCNPKTIRRAVHGGTLPGYRRANRLLVKDEDVRAWIEAAVVKPERPRPGRNRPRRVAPGSVADLRERERELTR